MAIDSILHLIIGGLITLFLYASKAKGIVVLLVLASLALGKELYDHYYILGHCYPVCIDEHFTDFLFSLVFFFLYIPVLSFTQKRTPQLSYKHYSLVLISLISIHIGVMELNHSKQNMSLLASAIACNF